MQSEKESKKALEECLGKERQRAEETWQINQRVQEETYESRYQIKVMTNQSLASLIKKVASKVRCEKT